MDQEKEAGNDAVILIRGERVVDELIRGRIVVARDVAAGHAGAVAALLAAAGLSATASYAVTHRAREFAIRMALGADPRRLLALVLTQLMKTVSIGFLIGGTVGLGVSRLVAAQFPGADGLDVPAFAQSSALLITVMLFASAIPAMRAARVDPVVNLKDG